MDIYPEDLGLVSYKQMLCLRARSRGVWNVGLPEEAGDIATIDLTATHHNWMRDSNVDEQNAIHATSAFDVCVVTSRVLFSISAILLILVAIVSGYELLEAGRVIAGVIAGTGVLMFLVGVYYTRCIDAQARLRQDAR